MKPTTLALALFGTLLVGVGAGYGLVERGVGSGARPHDASHLEATSEGPSATTAAHDHESAKPVYTCPMHPQVLSDHPGQCPICGMTLVLKPSATPSAVTTQASAGPSLEPGLQTVVLSPRQRVLANVATAPVTREAVTRTLETTGKVAVDETRQSRISAWIDGRIDRLAVQATGATIAKGTVMATLYSPELVSSQQEYLTAMASRREMANAPYPELREGARSVEDAARQRLKLMGVSDGQIRQLEATRKPVTSFPVLAPTGGVIVERKVQPGQYVKAGDVLFDLADYSRVWVEASVYEADLGVLKPGQSAEVRLTAQPDRVLHGRVAFVQPTLDPQTRTGQLRIEIANPQGLLKPEMYANVRVWMPSSGKTPLAVPASAVIDTGRHRVVFVEVATNQFEPRTVMVGARAGDRYPVLSGLKAGERVAVSGGFLLDASAQLSGGQAESDAGMADMPGMKAPTR